MKTIVFDTETACFRPGAMAPELACMTWVIDGTEAKIAHHTEAVEIFRGWLEEGARLIGHNIAYDMAVMCAHDPSLIDAVFQAYEKDLVTDTMVRQKLLDLSEGGHRGIMDGLGKWHARNYGLADLARRFFKKTLEKDEWRMRYGEMRRIPLSEWPYGAINYPLEDARVTWHVYAHQEKKYPPEALVDQYRQSRAAWWLKLASIWGFRTTLESVLKLETETKAAIDDLKASLTKDGLIKPDGVKDTKATQALMEQLCIKEGLPIKRTDGGAVSLDAETCKTVSKISLNKTLTNYAAYTSLIGVLNRDVKYLKDGVNKPIHTNFNFVDTGRTSSSVPNIQNPRRMPGIRECFTPRPGWVYAQSDYDGLELRTLAQSCIYLFGYSKLADALNSGKDVHLMMAASILNLDYDTCYQRRKSKEVKDARSLAKVANFGFPGGLGPAKLIEFAARPPYKMKLTVETAKDLKAAWLKAWPEMAEYFGHINKLCHNKDNLATLVQLKSGRIRGRTMYTAACNSYFQGLGSDATKHAGFLISKACYADTNSPLYGSRIVNYIHDEFILETRDTYQAHDAAEELSRLMIVGANEWLPDVPATTEPLLMSHWSKDAERVEDEDKRMVVWTGVEKYSRDKGEHPILTRLNAEECDIISAGGRYKIRSSNKDGSRVSGLRDSIERCILELEAL